MVERKETLKERAERLLKGKQEIPNSHSAEVGSEKVDKRKFNKRNPKSGRKPKERTLVERGIQEWVDQHINEQVEITIVDKKTGQTRIIKKPRIAYALERLYQLGTANNNPNVGAITAWLDRALGKAVQPMEHRGDKDKPIRIKLDF